MNDAAPLILTIFLILAASIVFIWALHFRFKRRQLLHQERLAALEKGIDLPALSDLSERPQAPWSPRVYLLRGLMWLFSGIAISVFVLGAALSTQGIEGPEERMWRTRRLKDLGATEEQAKAMVAEGPQGHRGLPASLALFGLIPISVGAAYLVFYSSERKQLPQPEERA
jgi:hypothetical protein